MRRALPPWPGLVLAGSVALLAGCGNDGSVAPGPTSPYVKASDWVAQANWAQAQVVDLEMVETPTELSFVPSVLTFEAGKPYVLRIRSRTGNSQKHYFATEGTGDFFRAIATRKVQTSEAEYKAPYFTAVELYPERTLEVYFVPVLAGTYDFVCTIPGHREAGMTGRIAIMGGAGYRLDLEVDSGWDPSLASDPRTSGSHPVWASKTSLEVGLVELGGGSYTYDPAVLTMTRDAAYEIKVSNPAGNVEKHYYTATEFFRTAVTRKFEDSDAEVKAPYFRAIELLAPPGGAEAKLFVVPTVADSFYVHCTVPGHTEGGMEGTLVVQP